MLVLVELVLIVVVVVLMLVMVLMVVMVLVWLPDIKHPALSVRLGDACSQKFPTTAVDREGVWLGPEYNIIFVDLLRIA